MSQRRWRVVIASPAARDVNRLPMKIAAAALEAIQSIAADPRRLGKPLHLELTGQWSARRGPYRIIYSIDESNDTITVTAVAHRADVYRRARRG
ncbi:MAG TPA: type II toxin-antitoxin system RelE/ParE family toxin [Candidatus Dormibacteraeota bacterium]|nr:type II toxin-antitoxin system RelE/ParE family toxin [Candidatus Dormibacteraeota bacterium]